jgi:hypothetical protein
MWRMSTRTHGMLDYAVGIALVALPRTVGLSHRQYIDPV